MRVIEATPVSGLPHPNEKAQQIVTRWLETVKGGDPQKVSDLYAKRAVLMGTVAQHLKQGRGLIKTYFDGFLKKRPTGFIDSIVFQNLGNHAVADGNYTFELDGKNGERTRVPARFTFVVDLSTGLILTHHSSSNPETTSI
jgi:uncharacterized protein (TIGR02246 family)